MSSTSIDTERVLVVELDQIGNIVVGSDIGGGKQLSGATLLVLDEEVALDSTTAAEPVLEGRIVFKKVVGSDHEQL